MSYSAIVVFFVAWLVLGVCGAALGYVLDLVAQRLEARRARSRAERATDKRLRDERDYWFRRATSAEAYIRNPHPLKHPVRYYDSLPYFLSSARPSPESE